jgi:hypothetical protein
VTLPPGRFTLATSPCSTGSLPIAKTIGIATAPWVPRRRPARRHETTRRPWRPAHICGHLEQVELARRQHLLATIGGIDKHALFEIKHAAPGVLPLRPLRSAVTQSQSTCGSWRGAARVPTRAPIRRSFMGAPRARAQWLGSAPSRLRMSPNETTQGRFTVELPRPTALSPSANAMPSPVRFPAQHARAFRLHS